MVTGNHAMIQCLYCLTLTVSTEWVCADSSAALNDVQTIKQLLVMNAACCLPVFACYGLQITMVAVQI